MITPEFEYLAPRSLQEACAMLLEYGEDAQVLAGGSDLLVKMKNGRIKPAVLVSLKNLDGLKPIRYDANIGAVVIGARATHDEVMNSSILLEKYRSVCEAAHSMAAHQIRNVGTVGGNLVNAVPSADMPPILIALDARARIAGPVRERTVRLEDFFVGPGKTVLEKGEILVDIVIPDQPATGSNYRRFGLRRAGSLAVSGVACSVTADDGVCRDARVVLGAVAPTPVRAREAERILRGARISPEVIAEAGKAAGAESKPINDIRGSIEYRRNLVDVLTRRSLKAAFEKGHV